MRQVLLSLLFIICLGNVMSFLLLVICVFVVDFQWSYYYSFFFFYFVLGILLCQFCSGFDFYISVHAIFFCV